ncbi:Thioredoxin superfamily protein [Zea mays]|uniref:Thioredoxin superfamily protein n=1 Tax=Zea mays TaxID=4577 RepID=A0A1D6IBN9_MAIZE|nr:Thioredoxin superfamily protein [Zea mays]
MPGIPAGKLAAKLTLKYGCTRGVFGAPFFFVNGFLEPGGGSPIDYSTWIGILDPLVSQNGERVEIFTSIVHDSWNQLSNSNLEFPPQIAAACLTSGDEEAFNHENSSMQWAHLCQFHSYTVQNWMRMWIWSRLVMAPKHPTTTLSSWTIGDAEAVTSSMSPAVVVRAVISLSPAAMQCERSTASSLEHIAMSTSRPRQPTLLARARRT